jgi:hypothetical protein
MPLRAKIVVLGVVGVVGLVAFLVLSQRWLEPSTYRYQKTTLIATVWGAQPGKFGLFYPPDGEIIGPRTFAVTDNGTVYIFDTVKHNIKQFGADGRFLRSVGSNLYGYALAWHDGFLFLLDGDALHKYGETSLEVGIYPISPAIKLHEGYGQWLRVTNDNVLYVKSGRNAYRIFSDVGKDASPQDVQPGTERTGTPNRQGNRWYRLIRQSDSKRLLLIQDAAGNVLREIVLETADCFGSNYFLEEDFRGDIYMEIQEIDSEDRIRLSVWVFNKRGKRLAELTLPNRYYTNVFKKILVDGQGIIYQLRTEHDGVYIDKWVRKNPS